MRAALPLIFGLLVGIANPISTVAQESRAQRTAEGQQVTYVPPMRGAPDARVSGGTRGKADELIRVDVLAPDHVGLTVKEQPTLYWFNSRAIAGEVEITIIEDDSNKTVFIASQRGPIPAGIHAFRLAGTTARLAPNVTYQWSVTDKVSATEPSRNIVASGMIERASSSQLKHPAPVGNDFKAAAAYGDAGIWYDAIDALSQGIQQAPGNDNLRLSRADLLAQVGLKEAAEFDRKTSRRE